MKRTLLLLLTALLAAVSAGTARADVRLRASVSPEVLQHCDRGTFAFALWNDGADTIRVKVFVSFVHHDSVEIGPITLRTRLGPHDLRSREVPFGIPPGLPPGRYAVWIRAAASDSSRDGVVARFAVEPSPCGLGDDTPVAGALLLAEVTQGMGLDEATPTVRGTWGAVKRRYDSKPR